MKNTDVYIILGIVAAVVIFNLLQPTNITTTSSDQPIAGQGIDPFDASAYTVENLAHAGDFGNDD